MANLIKPDGSEQEVLPRNGKYFELEQLRELVGGHIEIITLPTGQPIVINEEGKFLNLQYNARATSLGRTCGILDSDFIVGNALVCKKEEIV